MFVISHITFFMLAVATQRKVIRPFLGLLNRIINVSIITFHCNSESSVKKALIDTHPWELTPKRCLSWIVPFIFSQNHSLELHLVQNVVFFPYSFRNAFLNLLRWSTERSILGYALARLEENCYIRKPRFVIAIMARLFLRYFLYVACCSFVISKKDKMNL